MAASEDLCRLTQCHLYEHPKAVIQPDGSPFHALTAILMSSRAGETLSSVSGGGVR